MPKNRGPLPQSTAAPPLARITGRPSALDALSDIARILPGASQVTAKARAWWPDSHAEVLDAVSSLLDCATPAELEEAVCDLPCHLTGARASVPNFVTIGHIGSRARSTHDSKPSALSVSGTAILRLIEQPELARVRSLPLYGVEPVRVADGGSRMCEASSYIVGIAWVLFGIVALPSVVLLFFLNSYSPNLLRRTGPLALALFIVALLATGARTQLLGCS